MWVDLVEKPLAPDALPVTDAQGAAVQVRPSGDVQTVTKPLASGTDKATSDSLMMVTVYGKMMDQMLPELHQVRLQLVMIKCSGL